MDWMYAAGSLMRDMRTNRLRRFLSLLGVIIGTAAVISSLAVIEGGRVQLHAYLNKLGINVVFIEDRYVIPLPPDPSRRLIENVMPEMPSSPPGGGSGGGPPPPGGGPGGGPGGAGGPPPGGQPPGADNAELQQAMQSIRTLNNDDVNFLRRRLTDAIAVEPQLVLRTEVGAVGDRTYRTVIEGGTPAGVAIRNMKVDSGRYITVNDIDDAAKVCVLGAELARKLFKSSSPLGREIVAFGSRWTVIGVLQVKGALKRFDYDQLAIVPITTLQQRSGTSSANGVLVQAKSAGAALEIRRRLLDLVMRRLPGREPEDFQVLCQDELIQQNEQTLRTFKILTVSVAAFSLLVSGIGIMNIMLVSVRERTREIGIWKAVGANDEDVLLYFLAESVITCLAGGLLGIVLGIAMGTRATGMIATTVIETAGWHAIFKIEYFLVSVGVAVLVGLLSGIFPAYVAAKLEPMEALHYD